jgi:hypothetical protein
VTWRKEALDCPLWKKKKKTHFRRGYRTFVRQTTDEHESKETTLQCKTIYK